ncbi:MAG: FHA domain-containing protein, partial [Deltaproteobacteria bacterium]
TMITANPLESAPPAPVRGRLIVEVGKEVGKVVELRDGQLVIGRNREADLMLLDIQVSRRHAELVVDTNGVLLRDLGSGNGTQVNGEDVQETRLVHGDRVQVGDHVLRFEEEGTIAKTLAPVTRTRKGGVPAPASGVPAAPVPGIVAARRARRRGGDPKKKKLVIAAAAVVAVLLVAVVAKVALGPAKPAKPAGPPPAVVAKKLFDEGMVHFRAGEYADALAQFEAAVAADSLNDDYKRYLEAAKREVAATEALESGRKLLAAGDYKAARQQFARVDAQSLRYEEAQKAVEEANVAEATASVNEAKRILGELPEAETLKTTSEVEGALTRLEPAEAALHHALEVVPDFQLAKDGLDQATELRDGYQQRIDDLRRFAQMSAKERARMRQRELAAAIRRELRKGQQPFDAGDFHGAKQAFEAIAQSSQYKQARSSAKKALAALKKFVPAYKRGMQLAKARDFSNAAAQLQVAARAAKQISPGGAKYNEVVKTLTNMLFMQGRVAFNANNYVGAYKAWSKAAAFDPNHKPVADGLADLEKKAETLYLEGYTQKSLNPQGAIQKWKLVLAMTPPGSDVHNKAQRQLAKMGQ